MKKFWRKKLFWLGVFVFGTVFLIVFIGNSPREEDERRRRGIEGSADAISPILVFSANTPLDGSWHKGSFLIYIEETGFGGPNDQGAGSPEDLLTCRYIVNGREWSRTCNRALSITVGSDPSNNCSVQGTNNPAEGLKFTCALSAYAIDYTGNETELASRPSRLYGIDWTAPFVSKVYGAETEGGPLGIFMGEPFEYHAAVQEKESRVLGCGFFVKQENESEYKNKGAMDLSQSCQRECEASFSYQFDEPGEYAIRAVCQDAAGNYGFGQAYAISLDTNHSPSIQSCRVRPTSGNHNTAFTFEVDAEDSDGDILIYEWGFGDKSKSSEGTPTHQYAKIGTYMPRVRVSDEKGGEAFCSTAWVVVEEF